MNIRVKYDTKDIERLVLAEHVKNFGTPQMGEKWICQNEGYRVIIENITVEDESPEPAPLPATARQPEEGGVL